jgi:hypothetical protein
MRRHVLAVVCALGLTVSLAAPAQAAQTVPASGTFSFSTGNGILPTWAAEDIVLIGVSPGAVTTTSTGTTARVSLPIVAKTGTANAAAGGFRMLNTDTGESIRCSTPTIDTRARVVDCVLNDGTNADLFVISAIKSRARVTGTSTVTTIFRGIELRINGQDMADLLNEALSTYSFSPSVTIGTGDLIVARDR